MHSREFVNAIIHKVVDDWPGDVTIVNGRARHPQSQGLVERALGRMLRCWHASFTQHPQLSLLGHFVFLKFNASSLIVGLMPSGSYA